MGEEIHVVRPYVPHFRGCSFNSSIAVCVEIVSDLYMSQLPYLQRGIKFSRFGVHGLPMLVEGRCQLIHSDASGTSIYWARSLRDIGSCFNPSTMNPINVWTFMLGEWTYGFALRSSHQWTALMLRLNLSRYHLIIKIKVKLLGSYSRFQQGHTLLLL